MLIYTLELNIRTFVTVADKNLTRFMQKDIEITITPKDLRKCLNSKKNFQLP